MMRRVKPKKAPAMPLPMAQLEEETRPKPVPAVKDTSFIKFDGRKLNEDQKRFLSELIKWGTQTRACMEARINPLQVEEWKQDDSNFMTAYEIIMDAFGDLLEDRAIQMALEGNEKMLMKLLQGYKPRKYGKKVEVGGPGGGPVQLSIADLARGFMIEQSKGSSGESDESQ